MDPNTLQSLLSQLSDIDFGDFEDDAAPRRQLLAAARALVRRLEVPMETMWEMTYNYPAMYACLKVALDTGVFNKLGEVDGTPKTAAQLAHPSVDPSLLRRLLRHLAAMHIVRDAGPDLWAPTRHTQALRQREIFAAIDYARDVSVPAFMGLPDYFASTGFQSPSDAVGNWQFVTKSEKTHFDWLLDHPHAQKTFSNLMSGYATQRGSWLDVYPTEPLFQDVDVESPLIVDVAGGVGHDLKSFLAKHPMASGRAILQDLPAVIDDAKIIGCTGFQPTPHDIFTVNPVKSARIYYLHSVLHDWPEDKAQEILRNLRPAMKPGYSRLLINELVVGTGQPDRHQTSLDITMAALFSSKERTEEDWIVLLHSAGFRVLKFWHSLAAVDCVIEAEPA